MTESKEMVEVKETDSWEEAIEKESWVAPLVDIYETNDEYAINAFMPGVSKENIKIKLEDESLVLMGRIDYDAAQERKYTLNESQLSNYYRKFKITDGIDAEKISGNLENGVLKVMLPKHDRIKPKTIEIN